MNKLITHTLLLLVLVASFSCKQKIEHKSFEKDISEISFLKKDSLLFPFIGHGVQWSAYPHADSENAEWGFLMTDEKWYELYKRLDYIQPHIIRVMDVASWRYYKGLDSEGNPIIDFSTQEVESLYKLLDYCQKRNITVLFGEWGAPGFWNEDKSTTDIYLADDNRWIRMICEYLQHLIIDKGYTCIKYYNLVNEPNGYWASTDGDWDQWKKGYIRLSQEFKQTGLDKYVQLAGPDNVVQWDHPTHPKKAFDWVYSSIKELDSITALYDIHIYADQHLVRTGKLEQYLTPMTKAQQATQKPFILGELGMKYADELREENIKRGNADPFAGAEDSSIFVYDYFYGIDMADAAVQSMLAGIGSAIAWDLDDAMHTVGDKGSKNQLKKWGMWNILGAELTGDPKELTPRPWSYTWTLLCNLFPPNSKIIRPQSINQNNNVRAVAADHLNGFTAMIVNQSKEIQKYNLTTDISVLNKELFFYEYSENSMLLNADGFPKATSVLTGNLNNDGVSIEVKPNSVVFVSTIEVK